MIRMSKNKNNYNNSQGLTLVELLVAITLLGFVLTIATAMILPSYEIYDSSTRRMSASQLAELAKTEISGYLRMVVDYDDTTFGDNNIWEFNGYHHSQANSPVLYKLEYKINESKLLINVNDSDNYSRIIPNVIHFNIKEERPGKFELVIETYDGENNAKKRINVNSRNY